ncbi:MAG: MCE family protein [Acidimicrobiales bacterium]
MSPGRRPSRSSVVLKPLAGLISLAVIVASSVTLIRLGNGDFSSAYNLSGTFTQASAGLHPGSQVDEQGVQVGSVRKIELRHGKALITLGIASQYRIPADATATVEPVNLFGADQVAISSPARSAGPGARYLPAGGHFRHTRVFAELGQLFSSADPLLSKINTAALATSINELAAAYGGQGKEIASSLKAGTALTTLLARTTGAQLAALDAFTRFSVAIAGEGPTFNHLAYDGNQTMPLFNAAERSYATMLSDLGTFSNRFAALLTDYRPQIDTILNQGDNVIRVLLTQKADVASLVQGLAMYAYRFGHGDSAATLPDGSRFSYFKTFIVWTDVQNFICNLIAPAAGGLSFLKPLQRAILSGNTLLNCKSQLAAFNKAQSGPGASGSTVPSVGHRTPGGGTPGTNPRKQISKAAQNAANAIYAAIGQAEGPISTGIGSYVDFLLPARTGALP